MFPADGQVDFIGRRQGRDVGAHRFRFARRPSRFTVRTDSVLDVRAGAALLWRHEHHAEEIWVDGWLAAVVAR